MEEKEESQNVPPVEEGSPEDEVTGDDFTNPAEPITASRLSPYALSAFATAMLGLFLSPQSYFPFSGPIDEVFVFAIPVLGSLAPAVVALWLVGRAETEIFVSEGRLGGVGFYKAARVISIVTIVLLVLGTAARFAAATSYENSESGYVEVPGPGGPAEPAEPVIEFEDPPN